MATRMPDDAGEDLRARVPAALLAASERIGRSVSFPAGATLFTAGQPAAGVHLIVAGAVRIVRPGEGRAIVVHRETVGGLLGEVALFGTGAYPATALALEPTRARLLPAAALRREIEADPTLATIFLRRLAMRAHEIIGRLDRQAHHTVLRRLASHLAERRDAARRSHRDVFSLGMTQVELADELGTVKEVIVRELRTLRQLRLIEPAERGLYRIIDPVGLSRLAGR